MQLFLPHPNPKISATYLDDKRVVKMVLETAQILCTVLHAKGITVPYKPTHSNHPVVKWAGSCRSAYMTTSDHFLWLSVEYYHRYKKVHSSTKSLLPILNNPKLKLLFPDTYFPPANCSSFNTGNIYNDYRLCLIDKWLKYPPKWTNREGVKNYDTFKTTLQRIKFRTKSSKNKVTSFDRGPRP